MNKTILFRLLRIVLALVILAGLVIGFFIKPISTVITLGVIIVLFVYTTIPYRIIAYLAMKLWKTDYVCITIPYQDRYITVRKKGFTGSVNERIDRHEKDHIKYFNERPTTIQCLVYIAYTIWYGYYNNPVEIRARKAEDRVM